MKKINGLTAGICAFLLAGCATQGKVAEVAETNQKILRENENRLGTLEDSISALNTQIAQLNNRVYEVRTRTGQKTSMRVVPVTGHEDEPVSHVAPAAPKGRVINPGAKPTPAPAAAKPAVRQTASRQAAPSGSIGKPENTAGPSGRIESNSNELGLPPADLPKQNAGVDSGSSFTGHASNVPVPKGNTSNTDIPVPVIPASDLSLPPEHPGLPPAAAQAAPAQTAPAAAATPAPARAATPARGEEAAYKAALNAARSGHTAEGVRLFRNFLRDYPNSRYTANADYWIGECLYSQGKYQDALSQFQTVNDSFPSHHKNADALLKAGLTLNRMGDKAAAQEKFKSVLANFPNSDAARRVRAMGVSN